MLGWACFACAVGARSAVGHYLLARYAICPIRAGKCVGGGRVFARCTAAAYTVRGARAVGRDVLTTEAF